MNWRQSRNEDRDFVKEIAQRTGAAADLLTPSFHDLLMRGQLSLREARWACVSLLPFAAFLAILCGFVLPWLYFLPGSFLAFLSVLTANFILERGIATETGTHRGRW